MSDLSPAPNAATAPDLVLCELGDPGLPTHESYSPFCIKVHRALRAAGLPYRRRHGKIPAEFKDLNPAQQVPVLLVDGEPVYDSTRILARIESLAPPSSPLDARTRAEALLWEEFADTSLNGFLVAARWADDKNWQLSEPVYFGALPPPVRAEVAPQVRTNMLDGLRKRDVLRHGLDACWRRFEEVLDQLELRAPDEGYWVGPSLTAADFGIFGQLFSLCTPLTPFQHERLRRRQRLSRYLDRVDAATAHRTLRPLLEGGPAAIFFTAPAGGVRLGRMANPSAQPARHSLTRPAPFRAPGVVLKGLAPGALALLLAACSQPSAPSASPDTTAAAADANTPAGGKAPDAAAGAPAATAPPAATTGATPPAATTAASDKPPAADPPPSDTSGGERRAYPEFVQKMIGVFQSKPPENPPRTITRYSYKGQTVFHVSAPCCDFQTELYDTQGNIICAPDGGITGRGDGRCPDFASSKKDPIVVWQDARKPGKTPTKGGKPSPKGTVTNTPPTVPPKPAVTQ